MATLEQSPENRSYTDDERLMLYYSDLQNELAVCSQERSDAEQRWHDILVKVLDCNLQIRDRGINKFLYPEFLSEREMPASFGEPEPPILTIVKN